MHGIKFLGIGSYVPPTTIDNNDFSKYIETDDEWIKTRTGISRRHFNDNRPNYYMGGKAAEAALADAGISAEEIGLIICSTSTPDTYYPIMACHIQRTIGAANAAAIDINAACTGFVNAMDLARNYLAVGEYEKILIVSTEMLSNHMDFTDRSSCVLFGDAAGAAVVASSDKPFYSYFRAEGDGFDSLYRRCASYNNNPFCALPSELDAITDTDAKKKYLQMDGKAVYKFAVDAMPKAGRAVMEKARVSFDDIDLVIPHQANIRIIKTAVKAMGIPLEKVYVNLSEYGNTSSACMPVCLDELKRSGRLKDGMKLCFVGFGAGLTYGAVYLEYSSH